MTKRYLATGICFLFGLALSLPAQWAKTYGGKGNDRAWSAIQDADGNFVVAGTTESFGNGAKDMWILKLSSEGKILWQRTYGNGPYPESKAIDEAFSIESTRDGRYIIAGTTSNIYGNYPFTDYIKFKTDGAIQWQKWVPPMIEIPAREIWRTTLESAHCIRQSADGSFILVGQLQWLELHDFVHWRHFPPIVYALKIDNQGIVRFRKVYGSRYYTDDSAFSAAPLPAGGYLISGRTALYDRNNFDDLLLKINSSGDPVWSYSYGGARIDEAHDMALTEDGGCVLAGPTSSFGSGGYDAWILKLDAAGKIQWQKAYGGPKDDYAHAIRKTRDGGYIVAGSTSSFGSGNEDAWVFKLDKDGNLVWEKTYGGKGSDGAWVVREIKPSGYFVAGKTASYGAGGDDVLALRLDKNGNIDASCGSFVGTSAAKVTKTKCSPVPVEMGVGNYSDAPFEVSAGFIRYPSKGSPTVICKKAQ